MLSTSADSYPRWRSAILGGMSAAGHLTPFVKGDPRASEAGKRGAQSREAKRAVQRGNVLEVAAYLRTLASAHDRSDLGANAAAVASDILGRIARGEIRARHVGDAAELLRVLVDIARLEAGLSTSHAAVVHVSSAEVAEHVLTLQSEARQLLASSAASTVADVDGLPLIDGTAEG